MSLHTCIVYLDIAIIIHLSANGLVKPSHITYYAKFLSDITFVRCFSQLIILFVILNIPRLSHWNIISSQFH